jgi:hypothetical protein
LTQVPAERQVATAARRGRRRLWGRWVGANAWAEVVGLGASGAAAALVLPRADGTALRAFGGAALVVMVAGLAEGGIVGWAQHRVLRSPLPDLALRRWVGATVIGALLAWALGMVPSTLVAMAGAGSTEMAEFDPPLLLQLGCAVALGLVAGPILGGAQALVLRDHVPRAWRWLPANAAAWAVGMPLVFLVAGGVPPSWPPVVIAAVAALTLAIVGAVVGAIHGAVLVRMLADLHQDHPSPR